MRATYIERLRELADILEEAANDARSRAYYRNLEEPFLTAAAAALKTADMMEGAGDARLMHDLRSAE